MPATTELKAKIDACRAILGCTTEAWNRLANASRETMQ